MVYECIVLYIGILLLSSCMFGNFMDICDMIRCIPVNPVFLSPQQFGEIEYVRILTDRQTGESKGLAYVKYYRAYHAALALENCDSCKSCN